MTFAWRLAVVGLVAAVDVHPKKEHFLAHRLDHEPVVMAFPMVKLGGCGERVHRGWRSLLKETGENHTNIAMPGAGMNPENVTPFETIYHDGFMMVDCVKDAMYTSGDKHGKNKHEYKLGDTAGVSIIHYNDHVPKEDREKMTHRVCFEFCRTVPNMGNFGVVNGRDCYCTPYYRPSASSSEECDSVCEGEMTTMCGGKSKSSIFAMHMCADTAEELSTAVGNAEDLKGALETLAGDIKTAADAAEAQANTFQDNFGKNGDPEASNLMQAAKVWAGELIHDSEDGTKAATALGDAVGEAPGDDADFSKSEDAKAGEKAIRGIEEAIAAGEETHEHLVAQNELGMPNATSAANASKQYMNIMYFVDKEHETAPSTCAGDMLNKPIFGRSMDECARACDALPGKCVGYQYAEDESPLCFLFSNFKSATFFTGCGDDVSAVVQCSAKLANFEGTTLKPDKSGKCKQCLKEATHADRCFA